MTVLRELVTKLGFEVDEAGFQRASKAASAVKTTLQRADGAARDARGRFIGAGQGAAAAAGRFRDVTGRLRDATGRFVGTGRAAQDAASGFKLAGMSFGGFGDTVTRFVAGGALGLFGKKLIDMASDANETDNVLKEVFGAEGQQRVHQWAEAAAQSMGRSKYRMRDMAGGLGAMLEPMVGDTKAAEEMSTKMSALAVDLGSFFNRTDDDALVALRAGLAGETEPLRRFGVVLLDATLQEYAHSQGINKKVLSMTVAEKTMLRYKYILDHTKKAQGDAARTANGFANATKGLKDGFRDLGVDLGKTAIPIIERIVRAARDGLAKFNELRKGTYSLEAAMAVLAGTLGVVGARMLAPFVLPAAAVLALILLIDDLHALFTGGKSAIGEWLDEWQGIGTADALVRNLTEAWKGLNETIDAMPDLLGTWELITGAIDDVGFALDRLTQKFVDFASNPVVGGFKFAADKLGITDNKVIQEATGGGEGLLSKKGSLYKSGLLNLFGIDARQNDAEGRASEQGLGSGVADSFGAELRLRQNDRFDRIRNEIAARRDALQKHRSQQSVKDKLAAEDALQSRDPRESEALGMSVNPDPNALQFGRARVSQPQIVAPVGNMSVDPSKSITVNNGPISINVGAGTGAADAARAARQAASAERRRTAEAVKRSG